MARSARDRSRGPDRPPGRRARRAVGKPAALVAVVVDDEERAGRVVRVEDGTLALDPARLSPELAEALRRLDMPD